LLRFPATAALGLLQVMVTDMSHHFEILGAAKNLLRLGGVEDGGLDQSKLEPKQMDMVLQMVRPPHRVAERVHPPAVMNLNMNSINIRKYT